MPFPKKLIGLFIGGGVSYALGMPLVWELSAELKNWLTPSLTKGGIMRHGILSLDRVWLRHSRVIDLSSVHARLHECGEQLRHVFRYGSWRATRARYKEKRCRTAY